MKKLIVLILVLAMAVSMGGCHEHHWEAATCESPKICNNCNATEGEPLGHTSGEARIAAVDTENLTATFEIPCSICGEVVETKEASTGVAPLDGKMQLSPTEWFQCLTTNIYQYGAHQTLMAFPAESEDNALVQGVMTFTGLKAAITFWDAEGNILTTEQDQRNLVKTVNVEAQFTNETAAEFYQLLMLIALTNNSQMDPTTANEVASSVMGFDIVADNGYLYALEIVSKEDHTVALTITTE